MMTELVWEVGIPIIRKVTATWDVTKDLLNRRITGDFRLRPQIRVEFAVSVIFRLPAVDELLQHGNSPTAVFRHHEKLEFRPRLQI